MVAAGLELLSAQDSHGYTPLFLAAEYGHHEVVTALLAADASPPAAAVARRGRVFGRARG